MVFCDGMAVNYAWRGMQSPRMEPDVFLRKGEGKMYFSSIRGKTALSSLQKFMSDLDTKHQRPYRKNVVSGDFDIQA